MSPLAYALSTLGFAGFLALDLPAIKRIRMGKPVMSLVALTSLACTYVLATKQGFPLGIPPAFGGVGVILMVVGAGLMIYSTLVEIPLAYRRQSHTVTATQVYQSGTYALCRHPGFVWLLIYLSGLVIVINLTSAIEMALLWSALEFLVVVCQDQVIFPKLFPAYSAYRQTTPFLIPTVTSLKAAIAIHTNKVSS